MIEDSRGFIPFAVPDVTDDEANAAAAAVRSGWLTTGAQAASFEREFADFIGGEVRAVAINSATAGLHLALEGLGIACGDEVIVPTWTFTASAEVVRYLGAHPVIVDVDPVTLNLDLAAAEAAITPRTKAIMPVHFAGLAVPMVGVRSLAHRHGLAVVEDAAHALPTTSDGVMIGAGESAATVFSFYATKTMTTGEGGMLVTRAEHLAARVRTMRLHGINRDVFGRYQSTVPSWHYEVVAPGYKYNLADPAAAIGRVQLTRARSMASARVAIAARYDAAFRDLPIDLPAHAPLGDIHAWHLYVIRINDEASLSRHAFIESMAKQGIGTSVHFIPLHKHPYWRDQYALTDEMFPVASREYERVVSLPVFSSMSEEQVDRVIAGVHRALENDR